MKKIAAVLGTGWAGGVAALRLSMAGIQVIAFERGKRWRGENMPAEFAPEGSKPFPKLGDRDFFWGKQFWNPFRQRLGLYQIHQMPGLQTIMASGVGGGSLIWDNVVATPPPDLFDSEHWPTGTSWKTLEPFYQLPLQFMRPSKSPGVSGKVDAFGRTVRRATHFENAANALGLACEPVDLAINFSDPSQITPSGFGKTFQKGCTFCGICPAGCPQNAKNSADMTYIAAAEALGAEVRPLHSVTTVEHLDNGKYRVHYKHFDEEGRVVEKSFLDADIVVVAAGTMGTLKLLLTSKKKKHLPKISNMLGQRFSANGNALDGALKKNTPRNLIEINDGPAIVSMIKYKDFVIEDHAGPTWSAGMVGTSTPERGIAFLKALTGVKVTPAEIAKHEKDLLVFVGVGVDRAIGKMSLNPLGMLSLNWPGGINNEPVIKAQHQAMAELANAMGREHKPNVLSLFDMPLTYHPLGGAVMADSPDKGVVDAFGRVFGYPGLYVADGSIIPQAIGRNPSYTIAALAERVAQGIISDQR